MTEAPTNPADAKPVSTAPRQPRSSWWTVVRSLMLFTTLAVLASWAARWAWFCDLACHFRVQYAAVLTLGAALLLVGRWYKSGLLFAVVAATQIWAVAPLYLTDRDLARGETEAAASPLPEAEPEESQSATTEPGDPTDPPRPARRVRILMANVNARNHDQKRLVKLIQEEQPDLLAVLEFNDAWQRALQPLENEYPYSHKVSRQGCFGIALYSRHVCAFEDFPLGSNSYPAILASCDLPGGPLTLVVAHSVPPMSNENAFLRNEQLVQLAGMVKREREGPPVATLDEDYEPPEQEEPPPLAIVGDLNCTSWSPYFSDLLAETHLRDSRLGWGIQPTWHAFLPAPLRIPIDHCLISPELKVLERRVGPSIGSDHLPIIVDLLLPEVKEDPDS